MLGPQPFSPPPNLVSRTLHRSRRKVHFPILHRHAKRDLRRPGLPSAFSPGSSRARRTCGTAAPPRRLPGALPRAIRTARCSLSISRTGSRNDETWTMRSSGPFFSGSFGPRCLANGPGRPSSRARKPRSQRSMNVAKRDWSVRKRKRSPVFTMWARSNCLTSASTRPRVSHGGFGSRPRRTCCIRPRAASDRLRGAAGRVRSLMIGHDTLPGDEEPDERQPQLAGVRHRPVVDQHLGRVRAVRRSRTDRAAAPHRDEKKRARYRGAPRPNRSRGTRPPPARAPAPDRSRGISSAGKRQRDRERPRRRAEQRLVQIGIDCDASSSSVGCSGRSAYGQKRSSGRYFGVSAGILDCKLQRADCKFATVQIAICNAP